jgi:hypothetical protein
MVPHFGTRVHPVNHDHPSRRNTDAGLKALRLDLDWLRLSNAAPRGQSILFSPAPARHRRASLSRCH